MVSFSPADEGTGVNVGSNVVLTFSETVQRGSGTIYLKTAAGTVVESFDAASSTRLSLSGSTLTLDPTASLANGTGYTVEFSAGSVRDTAGNSYAGTTSYNFTTVAAASSDDYAGSIATTGTVLPNGSVTGTIETASDTDWFRISLTAGQTYTFRLNTASTNGLSDPYLLLYSGNGTYLTYNDDSGGNLNSLLSYTPTTSDTYYLAARAYSSGTGAYSLSASSTSTAGGGGSGSSDFSITINYNGNPAYQQYFDNAAARWAEIIVGDLPDVNSSNGLIDDLLIDASVAAIDGQSGILAQAGFRGLRSPTQGGLPYSGVMTFDSADIAGMIANNTFGDVVLHEMGHVLGLSGYMWQQRGLVAAGNIYAYTGANALSAYDSIIASVPTSIPVETQGGSGTAGSHWSESVFDKELMTGYSENAPPMPLSIVTVGALADLGYRVNYAAADLFSL